MPQFSYNNIFTESSAKVRWAAMCTYCCNTYTSKDDVEVLTDCNNNPIPSVSTNYACKKCIQNGKSSSQCLIHSKYIGNANANHMLIVRLHNGTSRFVCKDSVHDITCKECGLQAKSRFELGDFFLKYGGKDFWLYNKHYYCSGCYQSKVVKGIGDFALAPPGVPNEGSLGVEVELAWNLGKDDSRAYILSCIYDLKKVIAKHDGSIGDGVEFVSSPIDLSAQKDLWTKASEYFKKYFISNHKCGMHVHVPRETLKLNELYKLMLLVHNPDNKAMLQKIAGREFNDYCKVHTKQSVDQMFVKTLPVGKLLVPKEKLPVSGHHDALSLSPRHPTLEFRIFASSTDANDILANIETVCALRESASKISIKEPTVEKFLQHFKSSDLGDKFIFARKKLEKIGVI